MAELCPICYESVVATTTGCDTGVTTACCYQEICQSCCLDPPSGQPVTFSCGNCGASTSFENKSLLSTHSQAILAFQALLKDHFNTVMTTVENCQAQVKSQLDRLAKISQCLDHNVTKVSGVAGHDQGHDPNQLELRPQLRPQLQQYYQAQTKTLQLETSDRKQYYIQAEATLKYLTRLGGQLDQDLSQGLGQDAISLLLDLNYRLSLILARYRQQPLPIPRYQPLRVFRSGLVVDDVREQFQALAHLKPRYHVHYTGLYQTIKQDLYGINDNVKIILVELDLNQGPDGFRRNQDQPNYLICFSSGNRFVFIHQGHIIYTRTGRILAVNKTWVVYLSENTYHDRTDRRWEVMVEHMSEIFQDPSVVFSTRIRLEEATFRKAWPLAQLQGDNLLIYYQAGINPVYNHWLIKPIYASPEPAVELVHKCSCHYTQTILDFQNYTVVIRQSQSDEDGEWTHETFYTYLHLTGEQTRFEEIKYNWKLLPNGAILLGSNSQEIKIKAEAKSNQMDGNWLDLTDENTILVRPKLECGLVPVFRVNGIDKMFLYTTPWDDRLVVFQIGPEDVGIDFY